MRDYLLIDKEIEKCIVEERNLWKSLVLGYYEYEEEIEIKKRLISIAVNKIFLGVGRVYAAHDVSNKEEKYPKFVLELLKGDRE